MSFYAEPLLHYRADLEWPLNPDGREKLLQEGRMISPVVYDESEHIFDPRTLTPPDEEQLYREVADVLLRVEATLSSEDGHEPEISRTIPCWDVPEVFTHQGYETPYSTAMFVKNDIPTHLGVYIQCFLRDNGAKFRPGIFSDRPDTDFVNQDLKVAALLAAIPGKVSPHVFPVKYYWGIARPEQIVHRVRTRSIVSAPGWFVDIVDRIGDPGEGYPNKYAMYKYPEHLTYVAMHAAACELDGVVQVVYDLEDRPELVAAVKAAQRHFAHSRDSAGVHTWSDSHDGIKVGARVTRVVSPKIVRRLGGDHRKFEEYYNRIPVG